MLVLDRMPETMNSYQIPFLLKHVILDQAKLYNDNTVIEGLMVLYSNVDCITTKMNEIKSVMSTRHEVSVFAFTEVKPKRTAFALTDTQIQVPGFELLTNLSKPNGRGIAVYVRSLLQIRTLTVNSDY